METIIYIILGIFLAAPIVIKLFKIHARKKANKEASQIETEKEREKENKQRDMEKRNGEFYEYVSYFCENSETSIGRKLTEDELRNLNAAYVGNIYNADYQNSVHIAMKILAHGIGNAKKLKNECTIDETTIQFQKNKYSWKKIKELPIQKRNAEEKLKKAENLFIHFYNCIPNYEFSGNYLEYIALKVK